MTYPFISLNAKNDLLSQHLKTHFGIEKNGSKEELVNAILEQEQLAGYQRPESGGKTDIESTAAPVTVANTDLPLLQQKRVKIIIASGETDSSDVYIGIGDWDALIKRDEEVAIPESAYQLLAKAGETRYRQNSDGTLSAYFAPRYAIQFLGYAA